MAGPWAMSQPYGSAAQRRSGCPLVKFEAGLDRVAYPDFSVGSEIVSAVSEGILKA